MEATERQAIQYRAANLALVTAQECCENARACLSERGFIRNLRARG